MKDFKPKGSLKKRSTVDISGLVALSSSDESDGEASKPAISKEDILHTDEGKFIGIIDRKRSQPGTSEEKKKLKSPKKSKVKSMEYVDDSSNTSTEVKKTADKESVKETLDSKLSSPKAKKKKKDREKSASPGQSPSKKVAAVSDSDTGIGETTVSPKANLGKPILPEWPSRFQDKLEMRMAGTGDVITSQGTFQPPMLSPEPKTKHKKPTSPRPAKSPSKPEKIEIGPGGDAPSKLLSPKKKRKSDAESLVKDSPQKKKAKTTEPKIV